MKKMRKKIGTSLTEHLLENPKQKMERIAPPQRPEDIWRGIQKKMDQSLIDIGAVVLTDTAKKIDQELMKTNKL